MTDLNKQELRRLAEAFPADLDWDSNTEPFFNGPSGESLGGGSTGFYCVYGKPFTIDGEEYDGPTYVERCGVDFAKFMVEARDGVLALIAECDQLKAENERQAAEFKEWQASHHENYVSAAQERDELRGEAERQTELRRLEWNRAEALKAENAALRALLLEASSEVADWGAYASAYFQEKHDLSGCVAKFHDAAIAQEASHD